MIEEVGKDIGLIILGFLGGSGAVCCGVIVMLVGVILIFTLKDDAVQPMMMNQDGQFVIQQNVDSTQITKQPDQTIIEPYSPPQTSDDGSEPMNETVNEPYSFPATSSPESELK